MLQELKMDNEGLYYWEPLLDKENAMCSWDQMQNIGACVSCGVNSQKYMSGRCEDCKNSGAIVVPNEAPVMGYAEPDPFPKKDA